MPTPHLDPYEALLYAESPRASSAKPFKKRPVPQFLEPKIRKDAPFLPITLDIETKAGPSWRAGFLRPFLVGLFDGEEYLCFRNDPEVQKIPWRRRHLGPGGCVDKAMQVLFSGKYSGRTVYAHNGGGFDYLFLLAWLRRQPHLAFEIVPVQSSILRVSVWPRDGSRKKTEIGLLDSMKLFPGTLDGACESFGVPGKLEHVLNMVEDDPRWEAYLEGDCRALREVLLKFGELIAKQGGEVATTTPATAMLLFLQRWLPESSVGKIERHSHFEKCSNPDRCRGCLHEWVRLGYKGGRVEILTMQGAKLHYFDINSSYPTALLQPMPVGKKFEEYGQATWELADQGYVGFVECEVFIPPSCYIPPLPVERNDKLIFPAGKFSGVWDVHELRTLKHPLVNGRVLSVKRAVWYKAEKIFEPMIRQLYAYRQHKADKRCQEESKKLGAAAHVQDCMCCKNPKPSKDYSCSSCGYDPGLSSLAKLLMNAFYGKFGMDPDREKIIILDDDQDPPRGGKPAWHVGDPDSAFSSDVYYAPERADADYVVPQIAAHVTSLARERLWQEMASAKMHGLGLFYVDTDAELIDGVIESSPDLGRMKDEYPGKVLSYEALQPKGYRIVVNDEMAKAKKAIETHRASWDLWVGDEDVVWDKVSWDSWMGGKAVSWTRKEKAGSRDMMIEKEELLEAKGLGTAPRPIALLRTMKAFRQRAYNARLAALKDFLNDKKVQKITFKGLPKRERTEENFFRMARGEVVDYDRQNKVRSLARDDFWNPPIMEIVEKSIRTTYDKRIIVDGGETEPLVLEGMDVVSKERYVNADF